MGRSEHTPLAMRIVIENPVKGVLHSLQSKDGNPLNPKRSTGTSALTFDFQVRVAPGPKFFGDQVRREGPERRFVYVRIGQAAGDPSSPWSRRMKIDIHDIDEDMLGRAIAQSRAVTLTVDGTGKDGSPSCATVRRTNITVA